MIACDVCDKFLPQSPGLKHTHQGVELARTSFASASTSLKGVASLAHLDIKPLRLWVWLWEGPNKTLETSARTYGPNVCDVRVVSFPAAPLRWSADGP